VPEFHRASLTEKYLIIENFIFQKKYYFELVKTHLPFAEAEIRPAPIAP